MYYSFFHVLLGLKRLHGRESKRLNCNKVNEDFVKETLELVGLDRNLTYLINQCISSVIMVVNLIGSLSTKFFLSRGIRYIRGSNDHAYLYLFGLAWKPERLSYNILKMGLPLMIGVLLEWVNVVQIYPNCFFTDDIILVG